MNREGDGQDELESGRKEIFEGRLVSTRESWEMLSQRDSGKAGTEPKWAGLTHQGSRAPSLPSAASGGGAGRELPNPGARKWTVACAGRYQCTT